MLGGSNIYFAVVRWHKLAQNMYRNGGCLSCPVQLFILLCEIGISIAFVTLFPQGQNWCMFFPTFQVRVVRFYQSACPPLPPPPPPSPPPPRLAVLLALLGSASSTSTSALPTSPTRRQALRQLPSSVRTAGRQPASCPAQCAPLDVNLGPSQLSVHRWTSTAR